MYSVSHANKIREYIATSIYYQCSVLDEILTNIQGDPKKCSALSESNGISLQIQDDISIKWSIFFGSPCIYYQWSVLDEILTNISTISVQS